MNTAPGSRLGPYELLMPARRGRERLARGTPLLRTASDFDERDEIRQVCESVEPFSAEGSTLTL